MLRFTDHRLGTRHIQTHRRDVHGGKISVEVTGRPGIDVFLHGPGSRRTAGTDGMSKRILVVEDQEDNRQIIRDLLTLPTTKSSKPRTASRRSKLLRNSGPILS